MTSLAIIGAGRGATVHAESARAVAGVELIGIGGRRAGRAGETAAALGCDELSVAEMVRRADMLIVAVPPVEVAGVLARIPLDRPLIVESPPGVDSSWDPGVRPHAMLGANLLHAPVPRRGLAAVDGLEDPHHLVLRACAPRPAWHASSEYNSTEYTSTEYNSAGAHNGVLLDLGGRLLPVLLAAAAQPVVEVSASLDFRGGVDTRAVLDLRIADGRLLRAELQWRRGPASANLEAAGAEAVVSLDLWPFPVLEVDGDQTVSAEGHQALHALGFVSQLRRLAAVATKGAAAWPRLSSGLGALRIIEAARLSARSGRARQLG